MSNSTQMQSLNDEWSNNPRWQGVDRPYGAEDVNKLQGTLKIEHTLARVGAERLWDLMQENPYIHTLGALTGNQAIQQVQTQLEKCILIKVYIQLTVYLTLYAK
jgi:isocitrate lyase